MIDKNPTNNHNIGVIGAMVKLELKSIKQKKIFIDLSMAKIIIIY